MAYPTTPISTANLELDSDVSDTLDDLEALINSHNDMIASWGQANGVPQTDASGYLDPIHYNPQAMVDAIVGAVESVMGAGSGLDADLLDGLQATDFVLADGTRVIELVDAPATNFTVKKETAETNVMHTVMTVQGTADSARGVGYGTAYKLQGRTASTTQIDLARIGAFFKDVTGSAEYAALSFETMESGTLTESMRLRYGAWEIPQITAPAGNPPTNWYWLYVTTSGLTIEDSSGVQTVLSGAGITSHGSLTDLDVPGHHAELYARDGSNGAMTATLDVGAFDISLDTMTPPSAPNAGTIVLYNDGDVLKYRTSAGVQTLATGSANDHGLLDAASLLDDDHTQYLLRQPTADVVLNEAGNDIDWRLEGTTDANLFRVDAGNDVLAIGQAPTATAKLAITSGAGNDAALKVTATSGGALYAVVNDTTGVDIDLTGNAAAIDAQRTATSGISDPLLKLLDADATYGYTVLSVGTNSASGIADFYGPSGVSVLTLTSTEAVVNDDTNSGVDFRVESASQEYMFWVDASADQIMINTNSTTTGRVNVVGGTLDAIYAGATAASKYAVYGAGTSSGGGVKGTAVAQTAGYFSASTGKSLHAVRNSPSGVNSLAVFETQSATDQGCPVEIVNLGTGDYLKVGAQSAGGATFFRVASTSAEPTDAMILEGKAFAGAGVDAVNTGDTGWYRLFFRKAGEGSAANGLYLRMDDDEEVQLNGGGDGGGNVDSTLGGTRRTLFHEETINITAGTSFALGASSAIPIGSEIEIAIATTNTSPGKTYYLGLNGGPNDLFTTTPVGATKNNNSIGIPGARRYDIDSGAAQFKVTSSDGTNFTSNGSVVVTAFYKGYAAPTLP